MYLTITRRYEFCSAHWLPGVPDGHKCKSQHGHNYAVEVTIAGMQNPATGFIIDFWVLDKIVQPIVDRVDHHSLNDIEGLENPTAENIAVWFYDQLNLCSSLFEVEKIRIYETKDCWSQIVQSHPERKVKCRQHQISKRNW